jgi:hypothetical protein
MVHLYSDYTLATFGEFALLLLLFAVFCYFLSINNPNAFYKFEII